MKNLKIRKGILSLLFAGFTLVSLSSCGKKNEDEKAENQVGYVDVENPNSLSSNEFVFYNCGDHDDVGISNQDRLLKKCDERDISAGIIIGSDAESLLEIFEDVEYTKSVIEKNNVGLPIYFNVDKIMSNDKLSYVDKANLISEYLNLVNKNNIYVGLYGTSSNLVFLDKYCMSISDKYDCFVVDDGIVKYDGNYSFIQNKDGSVISNYRSDEFDNDISKMIKSNGFNCKENFSQTGFYKFELNDNIDKVALKYDLSVNDILSFNGISREDLIPGTILRIPNQIQNKTISVFPTLDRQNSALYRGIDISFYQGDISSERFEKLSGQIDFAILKISEQQDKNFSLLREDPKFRDYYNKCVESDISVGGYYVTHATNTDEAIKEAKLIIDGIKGLNITFPIYIDYENTKDSIFEDEFYEIKKNNEFKKMLESVNELFLDAGFRFGIYTNLSTYSDMVSMIGQEELEKYEIWLSKPNDYKRTNFVVDEGPVCKTNDGSLSYPCDMNQVSWSISDLGIGNSSGCVDYNLCYKDYKAPKEIIKLPPEQIFDTKEYKRIDKKRVFNNIINFGGITAGLLFSVYVIGHRRKIKRKLIKLFKLAKYKCNKIVPSKELVKKPQRVH